MSDDGPRYISTKQIPKVEVPGNTLDAVLSEVRAMRGDVEILVEDGRRTNQRLTRLEERFDELDGRVMRASSRVKSVSESDLSQEARLAETITWRTQADERLKAIEQKTDEQTRILVANTQLTDEIKSDLKSVLKHPAVQAFALAFITFVTAFLTRHT